MQKTTVLSTYSQTLLQQSSILTYIIISRTTPFGSNQKADPDENQNVSKKIDTKRFMIFSNTPFYPFMQLYLQAYGTLSHLKQQIAVQGESIFKNLTTHKKISLNKLNKLSQIEIERANENITTTIIELNQDLDSKITEWITALRNTFDTIKLTLSDEDKIEFEYLHPTSELLGIVKRQGGAIAPPKSGTHYKFNEYFSIKCQHMIHHILDKKQQANDKQSVTQQLKHFQAALQQVGKDEASLLKSTKEKLNQSIQAIKFAEIPSS